MHYPRILAMKPAGAPSSFRPSIHFIGRRVYMISRSEIALQAPTASLSIIVLISGIDSLNFLISSSSLSAGPCILSGSAFIASSAGPSCACEPSAASFALYLAASTSSAFPLQSGRSALGNQASAQSRLCAVAPYLAPLVSAPP